MFADTDDFDVFWGKISQFFVAKNSKNLALASSTLSLTTTLRNDPQPSTISDPYLTFIQSSFAVDSIEPNTHLNPPTTPQQQQSNMSVDGLVSTRQRLFRFSSTSSGTSISLTAVRQSKRPINRQLKKSGAPQVSSFEHPGSARLTHASTNRSVW